MSLFQKDFLMLQIRGLQLPGYWNKERDEGSSSNETHENNQITCRCKAFLVSFLSYMWDRLNKRFVTYELCAWYKVVQKYARTLHMPKRHLLQLLLILRVHYPIRFVFYIVYNCYSNKSKLWIYYYYFLELVNAEIQTKGFCEATLLKNTLRVQTYYKKGSD